MRTLLTYALALELGIGGCASASRSADAPVGQTRTTSGAQSDPSYGSGIMNDSWSDPAASGYANHGSAQPGATTRSTWEAGPDAGTR